MNKKGIALLITVLFVMAITVSIGIGLKQVNKASTEVQKENFMLQTRIALLDILNILKNSQEIDYIVKNKSPEALSIFLAQSAFIPFEDAGVRMLIQITSARSKFNLNSIIDKNVTKRKQNIENFKQYVINRNVDPVFIDIMLDVMGGIKEDLVYNSDIFYEKPELFRDYFVSKQHFKEVKDYYELSYHENSLKNINFDNLLYFTQDKSTKIDLNHATSDVWEMLLDVDKERAKEIALGSGFYTGLSDMDLLSDEKDMLLRFKTSFYEPYVNVNLEMEQNGQTAKIKFEYDLASKKGKNFSYDI